ncbi:MAG: MotA/TolQ/ExbB proton channel family protein [Bacteroidales bacterium]|jgi:biopolymer transport protein ExbB|nr:MotA/TolQ/ExbB proton channel family protein [Bacteroidales bacterium]MDD2569606.1 MotA/TolQ/ExbB proton channel family protein [Bacteroidales bacterium]MDD2812216.1 MotA/TolQ/ExbB proton channel family protein [Bacteroidales bacterium]MDD3384587.1 MotA/TolQ/ExbB proton channel family protein [Bacteroidales bacterium]MDD3870695.1 MotA/TolQ/ExbB proton channel family protein [Bacteroidales bacterium]
MKKLALIAIFGMLAFGASSLVLQAQEEPTSPIDTSVVSTPPETVAEVITEAAAPVEEDKSMHQVLKEKFIEGGAGFMGIIALCLILGMAVSIERIIYLSLATTNSSKLLNRIEKALEEGGVEAAKDVCRSTRGPLASIFYQGLERHHDGLDMVEKSIISYGSVQMGLLEKGLTWVGLFIAIAPMLGFMGTVIGMIQAFDSIQKAGEISPTLVAAGIKVALLTTVFGLMVAVVLQLLYNYCVSKIDSITNDMEDSSISFMDMMIRFNLAKK